LTPHIPEGRETFEALIPDRYKEKPMAIYLDDSDECDCPECLGVKEDCTCDGPDTYDDDPDDDWGDWWDQDTSDPLYDDEWN
jgi:hypothetical protein